jgi:O-methyltransferase involved in polyketide biosynthesis
VERFGQAHPLLAQAQAPRARRFDLEITRFLTTHPAATVVVLGDGLETQFWRVDNAQARWLSVDLAETVDARRRLLPASERQWTVACSALDDAG